MTLVPGSHVGQYEILAALGAGGMGVVYRARDPRLKRDVALKVLPEDFTDDPDRMARFQREAEVLASLNHPHIAHIHGLEESDGVRALVLELVHGPTLADRIALGPIPIHEALPLARQIAEALEAAHEQGVIHRDLKPANIKVRPDGTVKVLDFGLAKLAASDVSGGGAAHQNSGQSPTITSPAMMTGMGVILGTAAYMAPEQARGNAVDKRSDIWAFGVVLFEMLAGTRPFDGTDMSDTLASVLKGEPHWSALPSDTPPVIRRLLRRCLEKDRRQRLRDMGDARLEIADADEAMPGSPDHPLHRRVSWTVAATGLAVVALAAASWLLVAQRGLQRELAGARPVTRLELNLPPGVELHTIAAPSAVISPDGTRLAFSGTGGGTRQLYLRRFDRIEAIALAGTETANQSFFSPDGSSLAFIASDRTLKTVSLADGLVAVVARGVDRNNGGAWGPDGRLILVRDGVLWQFAPDGGSPTQLTTLDSAREEFLQMWPAVIDEGRAVLFTSVTGVGRASMHIDALISATGQRRTIVDSASYPMVAPSGHLVFFRDGTLVAASFDEKRLEITGTPVQVADDVALDSLGAPLAALSRSGALVYVSSKTSASRLVWVSREGVEVPAFDAPRMFEYPRIGPDGHQIAVAASGALWVLGAQRRTFGRLTPPDSLGSSYGTWTPDGRRVLFRTATGVFVADADGTTRPEAIAGTSAADFPNSVSPDGGTLILTRQTSEMSGDVYALSLQGPSSPRALVSTPAYEGGGQLSPDGRWLLYASNYSGKFEVYVRPYPSLEGRWPVSTEGGSHARWSRDGQEIFFRQGSRMFSVSMRVNPRVSFSQPRLLFDQPYAFGTAISFANYDVAPDGQRFLMIRNQSSSGRLNVVLNWTEELKRTVSTR